jgi:hypothetical protein
MFIISKENRVSSPDGKRQMMFQQGEVYEVSEDFGKFSIRQGWASEAKPTKPISKKSPLEQLLELKRDDLNAKATALGIEDPASLPNKQAVAEAILATK